MNLDALSILVVLGGSLLFLAVVTARVLIRNHATRRWRPTPSRVIRATQSLWKNYNVPVRVARIEYQYTVEGTSYVSTDIGAGQDTMMAILWPPPRGLTPGSEVTAYYDPADPSRAVLVQGAGFLDWLAFAAPVMALALVVHLLGYI